MQIIYIGIRRFNYFSRENIDEHKKILVISPNTIVPEWLESSSKIVRVNEVYDKKSKVLKFNIEECINKLAPLVKEDTDSKIFCNQESYLEIADEIRKHFSLYNHMGDKVINFRDKITMKTILQEANLRVPAHILLSQEILLKGHSSLFKRFKGKYIIKPCSSVGSRGVYKILNESDFLQFIEETKNDGCIYEAEEYIDGILYEYDFAIQEGKIMYSSISKYSAPVVDLQEGKIIGSIMLSRDNELHSHITKFGNACAKVLGAYNGCFHMELFYSDKDELVFLEVAARNAGLMTIPLYLSWEGINMYDIELRLQTGQDASMYYSPSVNHISKPAFYAAFPKINGVIKALNQPEIMGDFDLNWNVEVDSKVDCTTTNVDFAGMIFVRNENELAAEQDFLYITENYIPITYQE